jgi:hypothetical protein
MGKRAAAFVFLMLTFAGVHVATAQQQAACSPDLFKDYVAGNKSEADTFALIDIVDSDSFNSFKQNFSGNIYHSHIWGSR